MTAPLDELAVGRAALAPEHIRLLAAEVTPEQVPTLLAMAQAGRSWAIAIDEDDAAARKAWTTIGALQVLGEMGTPEAVAALIAVLQTTQELDAAAEEAAEQLKKVALPAVAAATSLLRDAPNTQVRDLVAEVVTEIFDDWAEPVLAGGVRVTFEEIFRTAPSHTDRMVYAGFLGDLQLPESLEVLLAALRNPQMDVEEYETLRDTIERLGGDCPDYFFDERGQAYALDADGVLHCPYCERVMELLPDGELRHYEEGGAPRSCPLAESEVERQL